MYKQLHYINIIGSFDLYYYRFILIGDRIIKYNTNFASHYLIAELVRNNTPFRENIRTSNNNPIRKNVCTPDLFGNLNLQNRHPNPLSKYPPKYTANITIISHMQKHLADCRLFVAIRYLILVHIVTICIFSHFLYKLHNLAFDKLCIDAKFDPISLFAVKKVRSMNQ